VSFLDPITAAGPATELVTKGANVDVSASDPPNPGDVLTAVDETHATWQPGGGAGGAASGLGTTGEPVDVASAAPPVPGQVLTAEDAEHAVWRVPGLHYDPSIKFWTSSIGSATILPGTWGFIQAPVDGTDPVVVYIVSSLEAPPVDARFGLYVGRDVAVPVTVNVVGASQIQGTDGELGSSTVLLPGADYEWVFYHEDSAALWGLVSDTAGIAKRLPAGEGLTAPIIVETEPPVGSVLTYQGGYANWAPGGGGGGGLEYAGSSTSPAFGTWVYADGADAYLPEGEDSPGSKTVGIFVAPSRDGMLLHPNTDQAVQIGNVLVDSGNTLPLRSGAYYEFTLQQVGESMRWLPRGMSSEQPAPLVRRTAGAVAPNEWVLASDYSDVVNFPPDPLDGDSFAVFVDGEGCSLVPDTGDNLEAPNGVDVVTGPDTLNVPGSSYYEWIWTAGDSTWHPRSNVLMLSPAAVASAIRDDETTDVFSVGDKLVSNVLDPVDPQDAATKAYTDAMAAAAAAVATDLLPLKTPVRVVAIANVPTALTGGAVTIDGRLLSIGDRVLLTLQSDPTTNGIRVVSATAWPRAADADTSAKVSSGMVVFVADGSAYAETGWILTTDGPITLGTSNLLYAQATGKPSTSAPAAISIVSASSVQGTTPRFAREDHTHGMPVVDPAINGFRLTTSSLSGIPSDGVSYNAVYLTRHVSNRIALYSGSVWQLVTVTGADVAGFPTGQTAGIPCDVFAVYSSPTVAPTIEFTAWTNATTRATALVLQDGVPVKSGATTRRYLGTILPNAATTFAHVAAASDANSPVCGIWNQDNRIRGSFTWTPTFASWTPAAAVGTWSQLNAQTSARIQLVQGQSIDAISCDHVGTVNPNGAYAAVAIGVDSTTSPSGLRGMSTITSAQQPVHATLRTRLAAGAHALNAIAVAGNASAAFVGDDGHTLAGISADIWF